MAETPKAEVSKYAETRSTKSIKSTKSVSFRRSAELILPISPHSYTESISSEIETSQQSARLRPHYHVQDDRKRCCDLWPYCGEALNSLAYSETGNADNEGDFDGDDDIRGSFDQNPRQSNQNLQRPESALTAHVPNARYQPHYLSGETIIDATPARLSTGNESITTCMDSPYWNSANSSVTEHLSLDMNFDLEKQILTNAVQVDAGLGGEKSRSPHRPTANPYLVKFSGPNDSREPKNWPSKQKWRMVFCVASFTFLSPLTSSMVAPALPEIAREFHITNDIEIQMVLSLFVLSFAIGPILFGPLSELYGRVPILQAGNVIFLAFTIGCGFAQSKGQIMAFRFLAGLGGSAPLAIGAGVLGDLFTPQERGKAMAFYGVGPLLGPSIGPLLGSFIAADSTWRWMFWSASCASGIVLTLSFIFLKECYAPVLLQREAQYLRKATDNQAYHTEFEDPFKTVTRSIASALFRALRMLFTQPIVQVLALYMAHAYGTMYLVLATFPTLWTDTYHESRSIAGLNYISLGLGFFLGAPITGKSTDKIYHYLSARYAPPTAPSPTRTLPSTPPNSSISSEKNPSTTSPPPVLPAPIPKGKPEYRIPLLIPFSLLPPLGLLIYGWTAHYHLHYLLPNLGTFLFSLGTVAAFQCVTTYAVDAYGRHAASAVAAITVLRSLAGFGFPLFAPGMYRALGLGWGNTLLAGVAMVVGGTVPWGLWFWGERLRKRSHMAIG